jgi:hypothetical protein
MKNKLKIFSKFLLTDSREEYLQTKFWHRALRVALFFVVFASVTLAFVLPVVVLEETGYFKKFSGWTNTVSYYETNKEKQLTRSQTQIILDKRPENVSLDLLLEELINRGYLIEGINGNLKEAFIYAAQKPNSEFADNLKELLATSYFDKEAKELGLDISFFKESLSLEEALIVLGSFVGPLIFALVVWITYYKIVLYIILGKTKA